MVSFLSLPMAVGAETLRVAVASNFLNTMKELSIGFEKESGHTLILSSGSTGKHYAQIKNGAPFDVLFSADVNRPKLLEQQSIALDGSRFTYAIGRLALVGFDNEMVGRAQNALNDTRVKRIAIANPKFAPYGIAAEQVLVNLKQWSTMKGKLVRGENISQTYQFIASGNAQLGLVSYAQVKTLNHQAFWLVPSSLHQAIEQQAVIINDSPAARELFRYMRSEPVLETIKARGYEAP